MFSSSLRRFCGVSLIAAFVFVMAGCSTTNHGPIATMAYHDITSKYNAHFNTNEKLKATYKSISESHKDDFSEVLPVYDFVNPKESAAYISDLDDIIARSTKAVQLHHVSNWSDDHFLLIGQSAFLKGDYEKAAASFKYITTQYRDGVDYVKVMKEVKGKSVKPRKHKMKKKKPKVTIIDNADGTKTIQKEDLRPHRTLVIHDPARSAALVWLVRTYTRMKMYNEAASVVTFVRSDDKFYKDYDDDLDLAEADVFVTSKSYRNAAEALEKYIAKTKKKKRKLRPAFTLAQCYERLGDYTRAIDNYKLVLKLHPGYDLEFNAKMNIVKIGRKSGKTAEMKELLARLRKDNKFRDYWDQVYYELALIAIDENDKPLARKYLHKSVEVSVRNDQQLALSYMKLAELDYNDELYVSAKFNYDSTLIFLNKSDEAYREVEERNSTLRRLVEQLDIIYLQDSLIKLSKLSEAEQRKVVERILEEKAREEEEAKDDSNPNSGAGNSGQVDMNPSKNDQLPFQPQKGGGSQGDAAATWYFYNTAARSTGFNTFQQKWGRRKLEDNWRRKDKSSVASQEDETLSSNETASADSAKQIPESTAPMSDAEKLLANIPNSPEKLKAAEDKLSEAYYTAGVIYKDNLESYRKAQGMFEEVNQRLPKHKLLLECLYQLYLIALHNKNTEKQAYYKGRIITEFPDSKIAKFLNDPNYMNELAQKENALNDYLQTAYNAYRMGEYAEASIKCRTADANFKPNPYRWKFELLDALIMAQENRLDDYTQALNKIVAKATDAEVKQKAQQLLTDLNKTQLAMIDLSKDSTGRLRDSLNLIYLEPGTNKDSLVQVLSQVTKAPTPEDIIKQIESKNAEAAKPFYSNYKYIEKEPYQFVVFLANPAIPSQKILSAIVAFNNAAFKDSRLTVKPVAIDDKTKLLVSKEFVDKAAAQLYYRAASTDTSLFSSLQPSQYQFAFISKTNYNIFLERRDVAEYMEFFNRFRDSIGLTIGPDLSNPNPAQGPATDVKSQQEAPKTEAPKQQAADSKPQPQPETQPAPQPVKVEEPPKPAVPAYPLNENETHYLIVWIKDATANSASLPGKLNAYNQTNHAADKLACKSVMLDAATKIVYVKPLKDKAAAMAYYNELKQHPELFDALKPEQYELMLAGVTNYTQLIADKKFEDYFAFFKANYK